MALITKKLDIASNDCDAGRITPIQLICIFQEAIDNGDILEAANEFCVVTRVIPLIDRGLLKPSKHVEVFEIRINAKATALAQELRSKERLKPWWKFWK
jgi:hypothetical protein